VLKTHPAVADVLVHVDPEDDLEHDSHAMRMPGRDALLQHLVPLLDGLPVPQRVLFHYIGAKVEAEVFLPFDYFDQCSDLVEAEAKVAKRLVGNLYFRAISLNCVTVSKH
jgi:hypothetical protein